MTPEQATTYMNCRVSHREVGADTLNWFAAPKNTLRQAPDLIPIGASSTFYELKLNIKLNSRRARAEKTAPKVELSMQEEPKEEDAPPEAAIKAALG